jgi:hypothetical protein
MVQGPEGIFHLVWTSGWRGDRGFGYASSKDLIHWSEQQFIPVMDDSETVNVWAPEIYFDEEKKQFMIIWASTIPFKFAKGIEDENNNHRMYYTTTQDFKKFEPTKLFLDPGFSVIDAVIVKKDVNDFALVLKDNTRPNRNLKMSFSSTMLGPYSSASEPFTRSFTEGPTVLKLGDQWLIYFDVYQENKYGAVSTTDFRTFTDISDQVKFPEGHKHGTVLKIKENILENLLIETSKK